MRFSLSCLLMLLLAGTLRAQIVPTPRSDRASEGSFTLDREVRISCTGELAPLAGYLLRYLPLRCELHTSPTRGVIALKYDPSLPAEGYRLTVREERIELAGADYGGVFNAIQTLLQLLPAEVYAGRCPLPLALPCRQIEDAPAFPYRGMHVDVARTWIDGPRLKRLIDLFAHHKINKLHLHLADDEGWRLEIRSHPELAEIGGFRGGDSPVMAVYGKWGEKYGGYYTQEQMREIIRYAALRNIEIIPEIDLPGHSRAFARVHPEILCNYAPDLSRSGGYDTRSAWCVAREENYALLEDILAEVCELFPSPYIHIGGDEVEFSQWERCPDCRALKQREGMNSTARLEEHFMRRLTEILARHGKRAAVWNEAAAGGRLDPESRVHGWENVKACLDATAQGYRTVVMPGAWFYFDMRQSQHEPGHTWAAIFDASKPYGFDLAKQGFTPEQQALVEGFEGAFWTEAYVDHNPETTDYIDFMLFPRICSLAELNWHNGEKEWERFKAGLIDRHFDRLNALGVRYRLFPPQVSYADGKLSAAATDGSELFYCIDPSEEELPYTGPIATRTPQFYRFRSRRGTGSSPWVATAGYYRTATPALRFTSSFPESGKAPFSRIEQYKGAAWTARTCRPGDWMEFRFAEPLRCREILLQTGYLHLPKGIITTGDVEVSYDGRTFVKTAELVSGACLLRPDKPVRAVRIVSTAEGNGCEMVIVQSLRIKQ